MTQGDTAVLSRLPGGQVLVVDSGERLRISAEELPAYVSSREPSGVRWVWDDTAKWYPALLDAGVRVARCHDLRLCHHLLRSAPAVDPSVLDSDESHHWDRLGPSVAAEEGLFAPDETSVQLRAELEHERQVAAVAASPEASRLALLTMAESAGALVAVEMTHAGLPWRQDVHEAMLADVLGPRPPRLARPATLEATAAEVRAVLEAPGLNPDSHPELLTALRRAGVEVPDTRAHTLAAVQHPAVEPVLRYRKLAHLYQNHAWAWSDEWVSRGRFRPIFQPAGSVTGRWSSNGGGALSFPAHVRRAAIADDGWRLVVADVAQLEPRVLAGMSGDAALVRAASGGDLYQQMVSDGAVATRDEAKLGLLGAMYGATRGESGRMVAGLTRRYPTAFGLVEEAARAGENGEAVRTLLGRGSPSLNQAWSVDPAARPDDPEVEASQRRAYGRFTRNFVVQGTGAEWALCWIADLRMRLWSLASEGTLERRPHLVFFLHDEVVVHAPAEVVDAVVEAAHAAAASASALLFRDLAVDFPLSTCVVESYADAAK